jgi:HK97 family phage portal protein
MRIFGLNFSISKASTTTVPPYTALQPPYSHDRGNWWFPIIREPFTGAWQKNQPLRGENLLSYFAVYSCISLIAQDVGKLNIELMGKADDDLWQPADSAAFSPVLRKPNHYQTRNKFIEQWIISKLIHGNAYVLKERDNRGVVVRLYVLDPCRVKVLVGPDGEVFYALSADNLSGLVLEVTVPASEIIHDVMVPLYHPLCGVSPLMAAAIPVMQGLNIQTTSSQFFRSGSRPGGILTSPHIIDNITAARLKDEWEQNFSGDNAGKVAVLGDGLKFEPMGVPAEEAQLIEQLKWTAENVCSVFHVPPYMIGIAAPPAYNNVEALQQVYYSQCLQALIESIEALLDEAFALNVPPISYRVEFCLDDLLRMDTKTLIDATAESVKAGILSPNEARRKFNLPPTTGGDSPYLQQQNYSLEALAKRDAQSQPFAPASPPGGSPKPPSSPSPSDGSPASPSNGAGSGNGTATDQAKDYHDAARALVDRITQYSKHAYRSAGI